MSAPIALRGMLESAIEQVIANWDLVAKSQAPAAIHQLRVGIRRLRTVLRLRRTEATRQSIVAFDQRIARVGRHVGQIRDLDVLIGIILHAHRGKEIDNGLNRLTVILKSRRAAHAKDLAKFFAHSLQTSLRADLARPEGIANKLDDATKSPLLKDRAQHDLHRTMKRLKSRAAQFETASIDELHNIRKAAKTVRYTFEFYAELYPQQQRQDFLIALKKLQDVLGTLNDLTLVNHIKAIANANQSDANLNHAAGYLIGYIEAEGTHIRDAALRSWRKVKRTKLAKYKFDPHQA
ncbi:MAG: CHAD domain-containing protein [Hyphomicrobiaceae bacterium]|nr:CHAD domain-containing protein [Hyphomicrobiaceae bacterium]